MTRTVVPPTQTVAEAELDAIERALHCRLPAEYPAFLTTFGPGTLDLDPYSGMDAWQVWAPREVIARTPGLRAC